jgi:hypothetical protein
MLPVNRLVMHFKNLCNGEVGQIPQLNKDRPFPVVAARRISAPYGDTVIFTQSTEGDIHVRIYFRVRYANDIDDDDIGPINQCRINYKLLYL